MPIVQTFVGETNGTMPFPLHADHGNPGKGSCKCVTKSTGRMWVAHHDQFRAWVGTAAATIRAGLYRFAGWDGSVHQLLALAAAFALTGLNLSFTSSAA
jgi:hypothetical protein